MKVLIVDDDQTTRALLRRILERNLYCEVDDAPTGSAGWAVLDAKLRANEPTAATDAESPFDLCIVDVMMPQGNGLELLSKIRSEPRLNSMKVVLCSALTARTSIAQFASFKPDGTIPKPVTLSNVLDEVKRVMSSGSSAV